jgi:hypothetical protein
MDRIGGEDRIDKEERKRLLDLGMLVYLGSQTRWQLGAVMLQREKRMAAGQWPRQTGANMVQADP